MAAQKFSLDTENLKKIGKGFLIAAAAGGLSWFASTLTTAEIPVEYAGLVAIASAVINSILEFLKDRK